MKIYASTGLVCYGLSLNFPKIFVETDFYKTDKPSGGTTPWFLRCTKQALSLADSEKGLSSSTKNSIKEIIVEDPAKN